LDGRNRERSEGGAGSAFVTSEISARVGVGLRIARTPVRTVVPAKTSQLAKARLAPALTADERAGLMLALLDHCLVALQRASVPGEAPVEVIVVTREESARALAARRGAATAPDSGEGPNVAVGRAVTQLARSGAPDAPVCVLACDLPLLDSHSVVALWRAARQARLVIAPDRLGTGTNALVLPWADESFPFSLGPASCERHATAGHERGWEVKRLRLPTLGQDLDEPWDLDLVRLLCSGPNSPLESLVRVPPAKSWSP
jgi:2-phospho-L-lactate guanylyltransferase